MKSSRLPEELAYLEPAAKEIAKLPADELNEDLDVATLEAVLRERVKGLKLRDAVSRLSEDSAVLKRWLRETHEKEEAVLFIATHLMRPGPLARHLLAQPAPPEPTVSVVKANGWQAKVLPRQLDLLKKQISCSITILDRSELDVHLLDNSRREELQNSVQNPWANLGAWTRNSVEFGDCRGEKCVYLQSGKASWKQIDYALEVPGGFVSIRLVHLKGKDFDEMEFEQTFHTLKILPPKIGASS